MLLWILAALVLYAITGNLIGSALTVGMFWWFCGRGASVNTDPDRAHGEVDSDGDFGN